MEESYVEDLASHDGPVLALAFREGAAKRWIRGARRPGYSAPKWGRLGCRCGHGTRKAIPLAAFWRAVSGPCGVEDPVHARDLFMLRTGEVSRSPACGDGRAGRAGKAKGRNPVMDDREKSDGRVLPLAPRHGQLAEGH